jgi:tetratricopeptide (TPR) repeat protein
MTEAFVGNSLQPRIDLDETHRIACGLHNEGRLGEAAGLYEAILAEAPAHHDALLRLGLIRIQTQQLDDAAGLFRRAIEAEPSSVRGLLWLGAALGDLDRHEEGLTCYQKALSINPDNAVAHWGLGATLRKCGRLEEAMPHFERAIAIKPDFAAAHCALADVLYELGFLNDAVTHYETAVALQPLHYEATNNLANVLQKLGRFDEAIVLYERALDVSSASADIYCNLGLALEVLGRIEDAAEAYEKALQLAPGNVEAHCRLANLRRFTGDDPRLAALENLAGDMATRDIEDQMLLHFALGKACCDLGQHERSFHHWCEGNALKRARLVYDEQENLGLFERIRATFTSELMQRRGGGGCPSDVPVFVVGMPRSGTTLVEQILASHSKVYGAGEIETLSHAVERVRSRNGIAAEFPEMIPPSPPEALRDLGADYVALTGSATRSAGAQIERIVDKRLANFKLVGLIHLALPNARIIHVRRDPVDTCFSCFSLVFSYDNQPFTYDLGELGRYYRAYAKLMEHWRSLLPPGVMLEVQYEDLVADLEGQARAIVGYCGLEWEEACLSFHENRRPVRTASLLQVRRPIYRTSVGRWRPYASFLRPLTEALSAPDDAGAASAGVGRGQGSTGCHG